MKTRIQTTGIISCATGAITLVLTVVIAVLKTGGPGVLAQYPAVAVAALIAAGVGLVISGVYLLKNRRGNGYKKHILLVVTIAVFVIVMFLAPDSVIKFAVFGFATGVMLNMISDFRRQKKGIMKWTQN